MLATRTRRRIASLHRWLAVALSPVILLIILSGAVLAFRPILASRTTHVRAHHTAGPRHVDVASAAALIARAESSGPVDVIGFPGDGRTAVLMGPRGSNQRAYDVTTGRQTSLPSEETDAPRAPDVFDIALRVHKELWIGAGGLVTLASLALIFLVIAGPLLARPGRGGGPLGRHIRYGWILWPLVALLPLSLVMMKLHLPVLGSTAPPAPMSRMLREVSRATDLSRLEGMQRLPGGRAFLVLDGPRGPARYVYADGRVRPMETRTSIIGREIHDGTWAGPWSGVLNLIAAAAMLWVLGSGLVSFAHRRNRATRARAPRTDRFEQAERRPSAA